MPVVRRRSRVPRWLLAIYGLLILLTATVAALFGTLLGYEYNLPRIQSLEDYRPDVITEVFSDDGEVIGEFAVERRIIVNFDSLCSRRKTTSSTTIRA
jgi:penicillin-binding protein 1A